LPSDVTNRIDVTGAAADADRLLSRELGVRQLAAVIFNYIVGAGIFVLPAIAARMLGPAAVLAYLLCVIVLALMVMCFAEAGSRVAASGGPYAYIEAALGSYAGFLAGVLNLVSTFAAAGAITALFASSLMTLLGVESSWLHSGLMIAVVGVACFINLRGVRGGARLVELSVAVKLVPLVGFVILGAFFVRPENLVWTETPSAPAIFGASGVLILAFMGIEGALQPSGEVRDPERTVPRAAFLAIGAVVVLYVAIQLVAQGIVGPALAGERVAPLAAAAESALGRPARLVMLAGATLSMFGWMCGAVLAGPRSIFAFARDGLAPRALAYVNPTRHTPDLAILVYAGIVLAMGFSGSFERLAVLSNLAGLLVYIGVAIAAWLLRVRNVRLAGQPFRAPGGPLVPVLACVAIVAVIVATVTRAEFVALGIAVAAATAAYVARARRQRA
jgi:amino acid transporter